MEEAPGLHGDLGNTYLGSHWSHATAAAAALSHSMSDMCAASQQDDVGAASSVTTGVASEVVD